MTSIPSEATSFFADLLPSLKTLLYLIGGGLGVWGVVNLLEGYGNDNPGAKSQGIKQLMAGIGLIIIGAAGLEALQSLIK